MLNRGSKPVVRCAGGSSPANPRPAGAPAISIGMEGEYARRLRRDVFVVLLAKSAKLERAKRVGGAGDELSPTVFLQMNQMA